MKVIQQSAYSTSSEKKERKKKKKKKQSERGKGVGGKNLGGWGVEKGFGIIKVGLGYML